MHIPNPSAAAERDHLLRLLSELAAIKVEIKFRRLLRALEIKFDPNQPRVPAGNSDGGRWTSQTGAAGQVSPDVQAILDLAPQFAAAGTSMSQCLDLCSPLLERFQPLGSDRNQFDFRKCLNACLGRLR